MRQPAVTEPDQGVATAILERTSQAAFLDTPRGPKVGPDPCMARLLGRPGHDSARPGQGPGGAGDGEDPVPGCGHPLGRNARHCELLGLRGPAGCPAGGRADVGCPPEAQVPGPPLGILPSLTSLGSGAQVVEKQESSPMLPPAGSNQSAPPTGLHVPWEGAPPEGLRRRWGGKPQEVQGCLDGWS